MTEKPTVLIVEDDVIIRTIISEIFRNLRFKAIPACNGLEALEILESLEEMPQLITSDLQMPKMNGIQFIEKVRSSSVFMSIPIVILSSEPDVLAVAKKFEIYGVEKMNMYHEIPELIRMIFALAS